MENRKYIVRCDSQAIEAATFDEALRTAQRLRESQGRPAQVYAPDGRIVAAMAATLGPVMETGD